MSEHRVRTVIETQHDVVAEHAAGSAQLANEGLEAVQPALQLGDAQVQSSVSSQERNFVLRVAQCVRRFVRAVGEAYVALATD